MTRDRLQIHGIGCAFPEDSVDGVAFGMPETSREHTGFFRVRAASDPSETVDLQVRAARAALDDADTTISGVAGIIVVRNGAVPRYEGSWLSLVLAHELGVESNLCFDIKGAGCAGVLQALSLLASMSQPTTKNRMLVVGGGASGFSHRWHENPPELFPDPATATGVLSGDSAYAMLVGRGPGRFDVLAVDTYLDPRLATCWRRDGQNYFLADSDFLRWSSVAASGSMRVMMSALCQTDIDPREPLFFVGTNSGRAAKMTLCEQNWKRSTDERYRVAMDIQLTNMAEHGHLFGGDITANLCSVRDAGVLRAGDHIMCLEAGGTYFYSAAIIRVT